MNQNPVVETYLRFGRKIRIIERRGGCCDVCGELVPPCSRCTGHECSECPHEPRHRGKAAHGE